MKTKEENRGKEEELPKKRELLSEEELLKVVAGYADQKCFQECRIKGEKKSDCFQHCKNG